MFCRRRCRKSTHKYSRDSVFDVCMAHEKIGALCFRRTANISRVCVGNRITVLQSMKLGIDVNRHKEIIVKAISALLLLLLKHFKLNHIYQVRLSLFAIPLSARMLLMSLAELTLCSADKLAAEAKHHSSQDSERERARERQQ